MFLESVLNPLWNKEIDLKTLSMWQGQVNGDDKTYTID